MKFIDISKYNTIKDWAALAKTGYSIMIRIGYRGYGSGKIVLDPMAITFMKECKTRKIPFGLYFMSQAITENEGIEEATFAANYAKQYGAILPIAIDCEDGDGTAKVVRADGLTKEQRTRIAISFCDTVNRLGFVGAVYSSTSWYVNRLDVNKLLGYKLWVAQYATKCTAKHRVDAWQYTSYGSVDGISGRVDISENYSFLPTVKKENPYPAPKRILKRTTPMMRGDDVKWLQFELGMPEKDIDGIFGDDTNKRYKNYLGF